MIIQYIGMMALFEPYIWNIETCILESWNEIACDETNKFQPTNILPTIKKNYGIYVFLSVKIKLCRFRFRGLRPVLWCVKAYRHHNQDFTKGHHNHNIKEHPLNDVLDDILGTIMFETANKKLVISRYRRMVPFIEDILMAFDMGIPRVRQRWLFSGVGRFLLPYVPWKPTREHLISD